MPGKDDYLDLSAMLTFLTLRNTHLLRHVVLTTIILPRQARVKHSENSKKEMLLLLLLLLLLLACFTLTRGDRSSSTSFERAATSVRAGAVSTATCRA
eukprot:COSAG06_NODE_574_length_14079_cov_6.802504_17_plen_98_part_00